MFRKSLPDFRGRNAGGWGANLSQKLSHLRSPGGHEARIRTAKPGGAETSGSTDNHDERKEESMRFRRFR